MKHELLRIADELDSSSVIHLVEHQPKWSRQLRDLAGSDEAVEAGGCAPPVIASAAPARGVMVDFALARAIASLLERDPETADYARELRTAINGGGQ